MPWPKKALKIRTSSAPIKKSWMLTKTWAPRPPCSTKTTANHRASPPTVNATPPLLTPNPKRGKKLAARNRNDDQLSVVSNGSAQENDWSSIDPARHGRQIGMLDI